MRTAHGNLRSILIPLAAVAVLLAVYFVAGGPVPDALTNLAASATGRVPVNPGFVGRAEFGNWRLICVPGPAATVAAGRQEDAAPKGNACRLNQEVPAPEEPTRILLAANLSTVGPLEKPALMLRLPGSFRPGDSIALRIDQDRAVRTAVRDCSSSECVAASDLSDDDWASLINADTLQIMFRMRDGRMVFLNLGVDGLAEAAAALHRAQGAGR